MTKKGLALLIVTAALQEASNHAIRLAMINRLADKNCLPMRFVTANNEAFFLFTVGGIDLHYEPEGESWFVKLAENNYKDLPKQKLELI